MPWRAAWRTAIRRSRRTFVFDGREPGGNAKVNRLAAAMRRARHRLILFSDGNVRVRPDFLRRAVSWFLDPRVGLVSHLFRGHRRGEPRLAGRVPLPERLPACPARPSSRAVLRMPVRRRQVDPRLARGPRRDRGNRRAARLSGRGLPARPPGAPRRLPRRPLGRRPRHARGRTSPCAAVWRRHRRWAMMRRGWPGALPRRAARRRAALVPRGMAAPSAALAARGGGAARRALRRWRSAVAAPRGSRSPGADAIAAPGPGPRRRGGLLSRA